MMGQRGYGGLQSAQRFNRLVEGGVPKGGIIMWSGALNDIPAGWVLCNGSNGTPDLRDQFAKGAAAGADPGTTGGSATHTHVGHSNHVQNTTTVQSGTGSSVERAEGDDSHNNNHDSVNSEPPYYAVAFIMRI